MMNDRQKRVGAEEVTDQIRQILMKEWDPIGIKDQEACEDEYDSYIPAIRTKLQSCASEKSIAQHLAAIEIEWMGGQSSDPETLLVVAAKLLEIDRRELRGDADLEGAQLPELPID
jgi:hypothetical protein